MAMSVVSLTRAVATSAIFVAELSNVVPNGGDELGNGSLEAIEKLAECDGRSHQVARLLPEQRDEPAGGEVEEVLQEFVG